MTGVFRLVGRRLYTQSEIECRSIPAGFRGRGRRARDAVFTSWKILPPKHIGAGSFSASHNSSLRSWLLIYAVSFPNSRNPYISRMELGWHRLKPYTAVHGDHMADGQKLQVRTIQRLWFILFVCDRRYAGRAPQEVIHPEWWRKMRRNNSGET